MEHKAKILYICDKYTEQVYPSLVNKVSEKHNEKKGFFLEFAEKELEISSSLDLSVLLDDYDVIVLNYGVQEAVEKNSFDYSLQIIKDIAEYADNHQKRLILFTFPKVIKHARKYNSEISSVSRQYQFRIANIAFYWKNSHGKKLSIKSGKISDDAIKLYVDAALPVLTRTKTLVLWQYNGRYAHCNYACPYCYVATSVNKGMHIVHELDEWEKAFERHFGNKDTVFYFSYGEPTMGGKHFYDALEMIGRHPNWQARMTSNVSIPLDRLLSTTLAKEGRLNINASFHPTQVSVEKFIEQCNNIRKAGIEPSVIYVMYPDQIDDFETKYYPEFEKNHYRVHIRAFRGLYHGKKYPQMYTKEQWEKTARYMDMTNFKYQLHAVMGLGRMSNLGMTHILVDNYGKIEMCDSYVGDRHYGNVFDDKIYLDLEPHPFPGLVPLAAVDDIADYTELEFLDLENNNVNDFNTQGGTIKNADDSIEYPFDTIDLKDKKLINELKKVPKPMVSAYKYWFNPKWFAQHFIYSYVIKKYGKYVFAWFGGKFRLLKQGNLKLKNFWHS